MKAKIRLTLVALIFSLSTILLPFPSDSATDSKSMNNGTTPQLKIMGQGSFNLIIFHNQSKKRNDLDFGNGRQSPGGPSDPIVNNAQAQVIYDHNFPIGASFNDSRLGFTVEGKTDCGTHYGWSIVVDGNAEQTSYDKTIKDNHIFLGGNWGRLSLGGQRGVEDRMAFGGFDPLGGTGGFGNTIFTEAALITNGALTSVELVGYTANSTKITFLTPRYFGIQAGLSFTPKQFHYGSANMNSSTSLSINPKNQPFDKNNLALGLNFIHKFSNGLKMNLSGTGVIANSKPAFINSPWEIRNNAGNIVASGSGKPSNTRSYAVGFLLEYQGYEFGAELGNNGRSQQIKSPVGGIKLNSGWFIDAGLGYTWSANKVSLGYYYGARRTAVLSSRDFFTKGTARTHMVTASYDKKLAPGLVVYAEFNYLQLKNPGVKADTMIANSLRGSNPNIGPFGRNDAHVYIFGTRIVF